ncbi:fused MFS/spermidine synthase [Salinirubellus salinus]|uniref:Polyamine aminopropyltransferase n=1 Tax=Salinirubellus salinus TaxID=1364945 RepID=A0A9E7R8P1_9EURY|nr:fused MFS/spermidine synthase [Salinirubellus salinus]UWM56573.1 fused MFS/spermidine synthase [Salinirubellus salinus]
MRSPLPDPDTLPLSRPEVAVFVSGVTSMGLEILAGRMIAPQFGSSIYTWGSIIGVFLAALSYGYWRGGKKATLATDARMARVFLLTAVYVALLLFAGDLLLRSMSGVPLPSRFASLPAITLLFGPPTYLLGYISPYAAELSTKTGLGEASGHVYALGTVGSIVGAFGTTFFLVPELGIDGIALVFGLLSVATALWVGYEEFGRRQVAAVGVVALLLLVAVAGPALGVTVEGRTVYETQTPYQQLRVSDLGDTRTLYLDGQRHSAMDLDDPYRHVFDYTRYFHLPFLVADDPDDIERVLFVGGGGFSGPKRFVHEYPNVTVDVVEIDPEVIRVAEEYFAVEESERLNIYRADGREFLRETDTEYDLVVLDAYRKDKVPFEMTTVEFMQLASDRLDEDGILFANLISSPDGAASDFYRAEYKTMHRVFPTVYTFPTVDANVVQNVEVVATKDRTRLTEQQLLDRNAARDVGIDLEREVRYYREPPRTEDVPVLRDDRAPVDSLLDPMVGQRYVVSEANETETPAAVRPVAD